MNPLSFIPGPWQVWVRIAALVALVLLGAGVTWKVDAWRYGSEIAALKAEHAQTVTDSYKAAQAAQARAIADRDKLAGQLAASSASYQSDLTRKEHENQALRTAVASGTRIVRVNDATCGAAGDDLPEAASGGRVDPSAGATLTAAGGQRVLDLRAAAGRVDTKLAACQAAVKCLTGQGPCNPLLQPPKE